MRFIHLADIHLGACPDQGCAWGKGREEEIWSTFRRIIAHIRKDPVECLFISGNLFDRQPLSRELKEVNDLFSSIPDTRIFLMAGSCDYAGESSSFRTFAWNENVYFFSDRKMTCFELEDLGLCVYGLSYDRPRMDVSTCYDVKPHPGVLNVLLAHGRMNPAVPVKNGFDYTALGGLGNAKIVIKDRAVFPGSLEPVSPKETGKHGYMLGEYRNGRLNVSFVPFARRAYLPIVLECTPDSTQTSLEAELEKMISQLGAQNIFTVSVTGKRAVDFLLMTQKLFEKGNILSVNDQTKPDFDLPSLLKRHQGTIVEAYILSFTSRGKMTQVQEKALYYGLQALLESRELVRGHR